MILQVQLSCKTIPDMPRKKAIEANTLLRGLDLDDKMSCQIRKIGFRWLISTRFLNNVFVSLESIILSNWYKMNMCH